MNSPIDADKALCIAYLDGLLDEQRRIEFELRLAAEPELARTLRGLAGVDDMLRRIAAHDSVDSARTRRMRPWIWAASLAAAAVLVVALGARLWSNGPATIECEVALAPGFESALAYLESVPELAGLRPPGVEVTRGSQQPVNIDAGVFIDRARAAERRAANAALASATSVVEAGYFVVPLELHESASVVVYGVAASGSVQMLFPSTRALASTVLPPGSYVLPASRFDLDGTAGAPPLRYERGFLVPLGARSLDVVVGVSTRAVDTAALPQESLASTGDALASALRAADFRVFRLRVTEPR